MWTIPLADDFPQHGSGDPAAEDRVKFGVACREGFIGVGQECLEWAGRSSVFAAYEGYDLVHLVGGYFARTRDVAGSGQQNVGNVSEAP